MDEAFKTNKLRDASFYHQFLTGKIIDIGGGADLVTPSAERFDIEDGDANFITRYRDPESFDSVHSSHCLEHMHDPESALREWWQLVKPGGYMVLVVPDEDLYEQGFWPSIFNLDHKNTFRIHENESWSPVSFNIKELIRKLSNVEIISIEIHDNNYDYSFKSFYHTIYNGLPFIFKLKKKMISVLPTFRQLFLVQIENYLHKNYHYPIDQTTRNALAQIEIVVKKSKIL